MPYKLYHLAQNTDQAAAYAPWCELCEAPKPPALTAGYALWLDSHGLALLPARDARPFRLEPAMLDKRLRGKSLLAQACGAKRGVDFSVLDAFAGFGLDALTLAHLGCQVTAVEEHLLVWLLLRDFVARVDTAIQTRHANVMDLLAETQQQWDVVYLDPMFATRQKAALPNLGLQHLQNLTAAKTVDIEKVLELARPRARNRIVLKRRRKDQVIANPAYQLKGQAVRFDVYL